MRKRKHLFVKAFAVVSIAILLVSLNLVHGAAVSQDLTFTPSADTYVRSDNPNANYGTATTLRVDDSPIVYSFTRFTVSGLGGKTVTKAVLKIHANSSSSKGLVAKSVADNSWGETTLTYANAPAQSSTLATSSTVAKGTWVSLDVTSFVKGEGTFSFGISTPGSTAISLSSRESGADAPQLGVTVTDTATPTATNPLTATNTPTPISASGQNMTLVPEADTYARSDYPTTNYGSGTTLRVDDSPIVYSFARFSVPSLNGQTITQAVLRIHANSSSSSGITVKSVADNSWGETTLTYANAPAQGSTLDTSSSVTGGSWVSLDVTSFVKGQGTYSFGVSTPGSTAISLSSRESGADAPQLVLSFSGSATPAPTTAPTATSSPTQAPTNTPPSTSTAIQHVFVVVMENHSYNEAWNTSASPYITSLGNTYARATNYHATTHPSLPNYLDLFGGSNYSITTDCSPSSSCHINAVNLADNLEAKGLTWKGYMESMPSACYLTTSGNYAPKHNPFVYFDDIRNNATRCNANDVPYTSLANDLKSVSTTPNYAMITPNLCDDMHNCSVSTGDSWLKSNLPVILNSPACTVDKCLLILTWDEDDGSQGNQVLTIFAGSAAKTGGATSSVAYNHFSLLRTVEYIFGLPTQTSNDANANPMTDLLR